MERLGRWRLGGHATALLCNLDHLTTRLKQSAQGEGLFVSNEGAKRIIRQLARCVYHDDIYLPVAGLSELLLRTRRMIILEGVQQLEVLGLASEELTQRHASIIHELRREVDLNTARWLPWRVLAESAGFQVTTIYNEAIRAALVSLSPIADMAVCAELVRAELSLASNSVVASLLEQISTAIHLHIDMNTARMVWPSVRGQSLASLPPSYFMALHERIQWSYA